MPGPRWGIVCPPNLPAEEGTLCPRRCRKEGRAQNQQENPVCSSGKRRARPSFEGFPPFSCRGRIPGCVPSPVCGSPVPPAPPSRLSPARVAGVSPGAQGTGWHYCLKNPAWTLWGFSGLILRSLQGGREPCGVPKSSGRAGQCPSPRAQTHFPGDFPSFSAPAVWVEKLRRILAQGGCGAVSTLGILSWISISP